MIGQELLRRLIARAPPDLLAAIYERVRHQTEVRDLIGASEVMQGLYHWIHKVAGAEANICLYGESGTGKELVARAIHDTGPPPPRGEPPDDEAPPPVRLAGHVRELQNCLERAAALAEGTVIDLADPRWLAPAQNGTEAGAGLSLRDRERILILDTLRQTHGNKTAAAALLGISLRGLHYKLQRLDQQKSRGIS
jgi:DNA-binding NtrC family response regulator